MHCAIKIKQKYGRINNHHNHRDDSIITWMTAHCFQLKRSNYVQDPHVAETCLTGRFVHVCTDECQNSRHTIILRMVECHLVLADIPAELSDLNILEKHLIAKCITFAEMIPLPKGQQRAIHGNLVCVPSEEQALPRLRSQSQVVRVKLKRRLCYKGHQLIQTVTWSKLSQITLSYVT